uniref:Uncharacterized protein n=1 Tax=Panagrolaimus sp. JU765 TaxID=591449 RepID=A0AC34QHX8_9BILA
MVSCNDVIVHIVEFVKFLLLFNAFDLFLRMNSKVDFNNDPNIMSTFCYRQLEFKIRCVIKLPEKDKRYRLLSARVDYYGQGKHIMPEDMCNAYEKYKAYRERNINYETDKIVSFYVRIVVVSTLFVYACSLFYDETKFQPNLYAVVWISCCMVVFCMAFIVLYFKSFRDDPIKEKDCPELKISEGKPILVYNFV